MGQKIPIQDTPTSADIRSYIKDMTLELAVMAARAGDFGLARRLEAVIEPPVLPFWPALDQRGADQLAGTSGFQT